MDADSGSFCKTSVVEKGTQAEFTQDKPALPRLTLLSRLTTARSFAWPPEPKQRAPAQPTQARRRAQARAREHAPPGRAGFWPLAGTDTAAGARSWRGLDPWPRGAELLGQTPVKLPGG